MTKIAQGISDEWVNKMIKCNKYIELHDFIDAKDCFESVEIKGGVNYFLYSSKYTGECKYCIHKNGMVSCVKKYLDSIGAGVIIRDEYAERIISKIVEVDCEYFNNYSFSSFVSPKHYFDRDEQLSSNWKGYKKNMDSKHYIKFYVNRNLEECGFGWIKESDIPKGIESLLLHKVYIPKVGGSGKDQIILGKPFYGEPNSVCSYTYLVIGYDPIHHKLSKKECQNIIKYIRTCFFRYLVSIKKKTQDNARDVFQFVPLQDFTSNSDIDWSRSIGEIDAQLYEKYGLERDEIDFIERMIKPME